MTDQKPKRQRGAPPGNKNRWVHGRYSAEAIAQRKADFAQLRNAVLLDRLATLLARAHNEGILR